MSEVDVMYNPDIIGSVLDDMESQMTTKCQQLQREADFMCTTIKQKFQVEIIKLPKDVKKMSLARFKEEFGESIGAVISGKGVSKERARSDFQTPSGKNRNVAQTPGTAMRKPKAGEIILSENGSPLGEFTATVVKEKSSRTLVPSTPGVHVPLSDGQVLNIDNVDTMDTEEKEDALVKMQAMMDNMQLLMEKLQKK
jgi:hypothetical protein